MSAPRDQLYAWLDRAGLQHAYDNFKALGMDLKSLASLQMQDYQSVGVTSMPDRRKLFELIQIIKREGYNELVDSGTTSTSTQGTPVQSHVANAPPLVVETSDRTQAVTPVVLRSPQPAAPPPNRRPSPGRRIEAPAPPQPSTPSVQDEYKMFAGMDEVDDRGDDIFVPPAAAKKQPPQRSQPNPNPKPVMTAPPSATVKPAKPFQESTPNTGVTFTAPTLAQKLMSQQQQQQQQPKKRERKSRITVA
eukprot:PhF_6_TR13435/c0_g1_i1/m.21444